MAQRYQREMFTNPEGRVFLTAVSFLWSHHGERKQGKGTGKLTGLRFLEHPLTEALPSPPETPGAIANQKKFWPLGLSQSPPLPSCSFPAGLLSEWLTLHKRHIHNFVSIKLAGLLYLPSTFSVGSFSMFHFTCKVKGK